MKAIELTADDHAIGPADAPVTVVEYGDYECPVCRQAESAVRVLRDSLGDRLRFVWRHMPVTAIHGQAMEAAEVAVAGSLQGRFWALHERLFELQPDLSRRRMLDLAASLGLSPSKIAAELDSKRLRPRIQHDLDSASALRIRATPTFFVNGRRLEVSGGAAGLLEAARAEAEAAAPRRAPTPPAEGSSGQPAARVGRRRRTATATAPGDAPAAPAPTRSRQPEVRKHGPAPAPRAGERNHRKPAPERLRHFAVTRARGPDWDPAKPMTRQRRWDDHALYMNGLLSEGFVLMGGPLGDGERILLVVRATDAAAVRRRLEFDPWAGGLLTLVSITPWHVMLSPEARE